ncbi:methyl-accepting chemotaxis protein [Castellaniella hirudinis]|uniref:methyl-accepting chemotaxis protein n=1 Tax=Castellaniella hirudinis TaxID=1144617 RepID=UPI0039C00ACD
MTLISITDTKGRLTYCNKDFVDVSGYTRQELLGQPHNILRHPDMPEEAFRDFWATIQSGKIWSGPIKNRRKNGDTYWVRANATGIRENGQTIGYLSVRTAMPDPAIAAAESLFATMRAEAAAGRLLHRFQGGEVLTTDLASRLARLFRPNSKRLSVLLPVLAAAGPMAATGAGLPWWAQGLAGVVCAGLACLGIRRTYMRPVRRVANLTRKLASGDLAEFINPDEFRDIRRLILPINQLALIIRTAMVDVRQFLSTDALDLSQHSDDMVKRAEQQATSLGQSAAAIEQISGTVRQTSDTTRTGTEIAQETIDAVRRSQEAIHKLSEIMHRITESSQDISRFTQVIESVAFQTNILALNASVEAARAGEHGRGFEVVATEVRALSQRTSDAARQIRDLIAESHDRIQQGNERSRLAESSMEAVEQTAQRQVDILREIHLAAQEESTSLQEVNMALQQLDQITHTNTRLAEELARIANNLEDNAQVSADNIKIFKLDPSDKTHAHADAVALRRAYKQSVQGLPAGSDDIESPANNAMHMA